MASTLDRLKTELPKRRREQNRLRDRLIAVRKRIRRLKAGIDRHSQPKAPKIVDAGLRPANLFGSLGSINYVTGHYTAGPVDTSDAHAISLFKSFDRTHRERGWGGIGYHYGISRNGTIILLRPVGLLGAHVGGANTGNVGVVMHGSTGDRPSAAQVASYKWLLSNAHTTAMPSTHRTTSSLRNAQRMGHNSWPEHTSNSCPGLFKPMYLAG